MSRNSAANNTTLPPREDLLAPAKMNTEHHEGTNARAFLPPKQLTCKPYASLRSGKAAKAPRYLDYSVPMAIHGRSREEEASMIVEDITQEDCLQSSGKHQGQP